MRGQRQISLGSEGKAVNTAGRVVTDDVAHTKYYPITAVTPPLITRTVYRWNALSALR